MHADRCIDATTYVHVHVHGTEGTGGPNSHEASSNL
jgi:hypothetical protein